MKVGAFLLVAKMKLDATKAKKVFAKVKELREEIQAYCLASDRPDLSVEDFQFILSRQYRITIEKEAVTVRTVFLAGMVERYSDRAKIYVRDDQDRAWLRFISAKELCHILIDIDDDCSSNGVDTIGYLLEEYKVENDDLADKVAQSEMFAEIAAIELMYPYAERCSDREKISSGTLTTAQIAEFYALPEFIVSRALTDWFHRLATTVWGMVNGA